MLTLVLGGARSGKSRYAEQLASRYEHVIYLATGQVTDEEMAERVRRHQADRPAHWVTVEEGYSPATALASLGTARAGAAATAGEPHTRPPAAAVTAGPVVLLDCVSFLVSNHLLRDEAGCEDAIMAELGALCALDCDIIAVSNEVGQGVVPAYKLGRQFRDLLGRANQYLAARAGQVFVCFAGIPVDVKRLAAEVPGP